MPADPPRPPDRSPDSEAEQILRQAEAGAIDSQVRDDSRRKTAHLEQEARDDRVLAELHRMEAEIRSLKIAALHPRNGFLRLFIRDLETNPHSQYKVHLWGMWYWIANFPLVTALFFLEPALWLKLGIFITLVYSIYANFATDYGGMSAAMAAYGDHPLPEIPGEPIVPRTGEPDDPRASGGSLCYTGTDYGRHSRTAPDDRGRSWPGGDGGGRSWTGHRRAVMAKNPLPPMFPWYVRWAWSAWTYISWPWQARTLKRHGFTRTGFMTWELGPENVCPKCGTSSCLDDAKLGGGFG